MGRVALWAGAALVAVVVTIGAAAGGVVSAVFGGAGGGPGCLPVAASHAPPATGGDAVGPGGLSDEQTRNAAVIVTVGQRMRVPARGWVIAIATALQESNLTNHGHLGAANDHDSLGLFQQRPSQGWGTPEQIMSPDHAAWMFYEHLLRVFGWQELPLTQAAQAVQRSAYPNAYARHEQRATAIVTALAGGSLTDCAPGSVSAHGWTRPIPGPVGSGYRTTDRPDHDGVDIAAPKGTVIRAASSGAVVTVLCNVAGRSFPPTGTALPCDQDGSPGLGGCGWYVEIRHSGDVVSRYCHLFRQPAIQIGQSVVVGQPIGLVGSSGNSSGPHLHFEIHEGYPATRGNAVPPAPFMTARGVPM